MTKNRTIADDFIHEIMLKALCHNERFCNDDNFNGCLRCILRNTYLNLLAKEGRYITLCEFNDNKNQSYKVTIVEYNDLNGLLELLPKKLTSSFNMHVNGYKYTEIASEFFIPLITVKNRVHFARGT